MAAAIAYSLSAVNCWTGVSNHGRLRSAESGAGTPADCRVGTIGGRERRLRRACHGKSAERGAFMEQASAFTLVVRYWLDVGTASSN